MRLLTHFLIASTLCLFGLGATAQAGDHIKDGLSLFSEQAKTAANRQIDQVFQKHGWTIAVETLDAAETIPTLPTDKSKQNEFLTAWTTKHYQANNLKGVYIAVFKNPSKFRIHIDTDQQQKMGVTKTDINSWSTLLEDNLREKDFDAALLSTVGGISAKLSRTNATTAKPAAPLPGNAADPMKQGAHKPEQRAAGEEGGPSILMWILIAGGVFIIFRIIRGVMSSMSNNNAYGPGGTPNQYGPGGGANMGGPGYGQGGYGAPGYGGRGGGMMSGMLGGLFGGMAGSWMYDKMSGGHQSHPDSGQGNYTSHSDSGGSLEESSPPESDSTTYGGDWGNDAGSGDSGGDYGGGGDFGGDTGGGGDW